MLWQTKTVRTIILTRFYSVATLNTVTNEVISSYDKILYDIIQPYHPLPPIFTIFLIVASLIYVQKTQHYTAQNQRIEKILENETKFIKIFKIILFTYFLIFWRNINNAI